MLNEARLRRERAPGRRLGMSLALWRLMGPVGTAGLIPLVA